MESQLLFLLTLPTILGLIYFTKTLLNLLNWAWATFFRPPKDLKRCYGSWALVTGAADGIGKAVSIELASRGLNLILLDRDIPKLETTTKEVLQERYDVEVRTLVSDLCKDCGNEIERKIKKVIEGLDVGVVINNAGMTHPYPLYVHEIESEEVESIVRLNVEAATLVTKAVLPGMMKRGRGAIVNIGSGSASLLPSFPLFTVYAATKSYLEQFSRSISMEYKQYGIDVQCQTPLNVMTKLSASIIKFSFMAPSPRAFGRVSVDWIGYEAVCNPYLSHSLQWYVMSLLPTPVLDWVVFQVMLGVRKRKQLRDSMKNNTKQI